MIFLRPQNLLMRPEYSSIVTSMMREMIGKYGSLLLLLAAAVLIMPLEQKAEGYAVLLAGVACLALAERYFAKHVVVLFGMLAVLGSTPIDTSIDLEHILRMGVPLGLAIAVPYLVFRYIYNEPHVIQYHFAKHTFTRGQVGYILLALVASYLILPFWMQNTGGYMNWAVLLDPWHLFVLFLGTNGLGIWDELFFIVTVLGVLRHHLPFWQANIVQAVLFTSFLYELGFTGWAPFLIFPFALSQGLVFKYTKNLVYIIAIHLTIDLVLYLALINAHFPETLPLFITGA